MKKVLLGTTAIVTAGMIASAPSAYAAEKIKAKVGGYMEQWFGYTNTDKAITGNDFSGFDVKSDAEINFSGSTKLDNGISIGINVQLEANSNPGDQIDESYMSIKGAFGEILLGSENSAQYKMHYAPSDFGIGMNSGDQTSWVNTQTITNAGSFRAPFGSTYIEPGRANDSEKVTYFTPRVEGFQLGLSYSPDGSQDSNSQPNRDGSVSDAIMMGANFKKKFGGANLGISFGYGTFTDGPDGTDQPTTMNVGFTLGVGGFGMGVSFASADDQGVTDGEAFNIGASYSTGPWGISLAYLHGEQEGSSTAGVISDQAEQDTIHLSGKYALGPGVTAAGTFGYAKFTSDDTDLAGSDGAEVDGTYFVVGLKVSF